MLLHGVLGELLGRLLILLAQDPLQFVDALLLEAQQIRMQLVGPLTHHQSACLMISRYDDDGLVGVLLVELVGHLHGFVHIQHLVHSITDVIAVAGVVDHAALDLEEETILLFAHEVVDASAHNLLQRQVVLVLIQGVGDVVAAQFLVLVVALEEDEFVGLATFLLILLVTASEDGVAGSLGLVAQCGLALLGIGAMEVAAGEEVEATLAQILANLVVHIAVGLMTVEAGWGGVCDGYVRGHAHSSTGFLRPHSNAGAGCLQVFQHADGSVLGLLAASQRSSAGSRVCHAVGGGVGVHQAHHGEAGHQNRLEANLALQGCQIGLSDVDLVDAHAVTNEVEYILHLALGHCRNGKNGRQQQGKETFLHSR